MRLAWFAASLVLIIACDDGSKRPALTQAQIEAQKAARRAEGEKLSRRIEVQGKFSIAELQCITQKDERACLMNLQRAALDQGYLVCEVMTCQTDEPSFSDEPDQNYGFR